MKYSDLLALMQELAALGIPQNAAIQFQCSAPCAAQQVVGINPSSFVVQGLDATYSLSAGAWGSSVSQQPAVILSQQ